MEKLSDEERLVRDTFYISELSEGGVVEIECNGKVLVRREGDKEIERAEG